MHLSASFKAVLNSINLIHVAHLLEYIATAFGSLFNPSSYSLRANGYEFYLKNSFPFYLCSSANSGLMKSLASLSFFAF